MGDQRAGELVQRNIVGRDLMIPLEARLTIRCEKGGATIVSFENELAAEEFVSFHIGGPINSGNTGK